jgi:hypothetical protein
MHHFEMGRVDQRLQVRPGESFRQLRHLLEAQVPIQRQCPRNGLQDLQIGFPGLFTCKSLG